MVLMGRFLWVVGLLFIVVPVYGAGAGSKLELTQECSAERIDEAVQLASVYDGDTLRLSDGRKVRLIGINAPEMARLENKSAAKNKVPRKISRKIYRTAEPEPLAEASRNYLVSLLSQANSIGLRYGSESHDRYGRLLAHVFVDGRINVQAQLLAQGLAVVITVPPNLWAHDCYMMQERSAVLRRQGVWALSQYEPIETEQLKPAVSGFYRITGIVERISKTAKSVWLNLNGNVSLRIDRRDFLYFRNFDFDDLGGRRLVARGWLYQYKGRTQMAVRHPDSLEIQLKNNTTAQH